MPLWKWSTIFLIIVEGITFVATLALIIWNIFMRQLGISTYQFLTEKETLSKNKEKLGKGEITAEEFERLNQEVYDARKK